MCHQKVHRRIRSPSSSADRDQVVWQSFLIWSDLMRRSSKRYSLFSFLYYAAKSVSTHNHCCEVVSAMPNVAILGVQFEIDRLMIIIDWLIGLVWFMDRAISISLHFSIWGKFATRGGISSLFFLGIQKYFISRHQLIGLIDIKFLDWLPTLFFFALREEWFVNPM